MHQQFAGARKAKSLARFNRIGNAGVGGFLAQRQWQLARPEKLVQFFNFAPSRKSHCAKVVNWLPAHLINCGAARAKLTLGCRFGFPALPVFKSAWSLS